MKRRHAHRKSVAQRREEAEARNAKTPIENTKAYRRRMLPIIEDVEIFEVAAAYSYE